MEKGLVGQSVRRGLNLKQCDQLFARSLSGLRFDRGWDEIVEQVLLSYAERKKVSTNLIYSHSMESRAWKLCKALLPTDPFTILEPENLSIDVSDQHDIC